MASDSETGTVFHVCARLLFNICVVSVSGFPVKRIEVINVAIG
jgi:hypothetical protein